MKALALGLCGVLLGCGARSEPHAVANLSLPGCTRGRAYVVVRHGEKASPQPNDPLGPPLSERGRARAKTIASMLAMAGVSRIVATQYTRTRETVAPLAEKLSLPIEVRQADATRALVDELRAEPDGAFVVIASHSNVLPGIVRALGGVDLVESDSLADDDYARVILITHACGAQPYVVQLASD